ncbi:MAG: apolipoprotein N-acyltransferase [Gammaproteobacteria bacterium]|nr:MAG: apolipoprotein N-acyltransferase [Pseudomonadota bacterium]PIE37889.1 MAG: apolipoprotein N-acyltransferase [Gammaproteobacteria bacterium]
MPENSTIAEKKTTPKNSTAKKAPYLILAFFAGALQTLTYAPFDYWPSGILSALIIFAVAQKLSTRDARLAGWLYGLGIYGSGASWVYVSIHDYGYTSAPLAALLTFLFVAFLALFQLLQLYLYKRAETGNSLFNALLFAGVWVLTDWFRSWFMTGFPWLYLGYGLTDSPIAWLAPVGGVHLVTFVVVLTGCTLLTIVTARQQRQRLAFLLPIALLWLLSPLNKVSWTQLDTEYPITASVIQGNIDQRIKWNPAYRTYSIQVYEKLSAPHWKNSDIILWPETAIPLFQNTARFITDTLAEQASRTDTTLITGIPYRETPSDPDARTIYHNSITSLGNGTGFYHKQKLVPFGEYIPLESMLRGLIGFLDLPMSSFTPGPPDQNGLTAGGLNIAPFICYEIVYPDFVATSAKQNNILLTISNDAWFGQSIAPEQHLEIAQMRSLETGRYMVRGTNNGISAIIDHKGKITKKTDQFFATSLTGTVYSASRSTPFMITGSWPIVLFSLGLLICAFYRRFQ